MDAAVACRIPVQDEAAQALILDLFGPGLRALLPTAPAIVNAEGSTATKEDDLTTETIAQPSLELEETTTPVKDLRSRLTELIPRQQERIRAIKHKYGHVSLGNNTVNMVLGGMRGMTGLLWEGSLLDAEEGIRFRGLSIPECQSRLPSAGKEEPLPEGFLWLLLTGEVPSDAQVALLTQQLRERAIVPPHVYAVLDALPPSTHPMTQFSVAVTSMQTQSKFAQAYKDGHSKKQYWEPMFEDCLDLLAALPPITAYIYRRSFKDGTIIPADPNLDYAANFAHMLGFDDPQMHELMRLYISIHSDHEGGNVSAHTSHLVGSALSDPYLCLAAGLDGLAGPLHGLANQEVLLWLDEVQAELGPDPNKEELEEFVKGTLKRGKVIPGYGHAILRHTDPRYTCQREFALKHLPDCPMFKLVSNLYEVVPKVLLATGKVRNPWPNVDAHSGVLLQYFGLKESSFYTVLFGVSRAIGILSQLIWDRALMMPIERPKSVTYEWLEENAPRLQKEQEVTERQLTVVGA